MPAEVFSVGLYCYSRQKSVILYSIMRKKILYLTDLYYRAKGRNYYEEDLWLTGRLKDHFDVALCHPFNSESFEKDVDLIVFRNTGGVSGFKEVYDAFVKRVKALHLKTFNEFTGKADMKGKQYLLDLTAAGYPVIPTVDKKEDIGQLPDVPKYVIKPKDGADSIGLEFLTREALGGRELEPGLTLIQPKIDFQYELSFYFINDKFEYALYAPDKSKRWALEKYVATEEDIAFATEFIRWNNIRSGIQRIDACRTKDGKLLLVELEDLNPYLSILEVDEPTRERFVKDWIEALNE